MRSLRVYKSYNFWEKDPVIDTIRTIVDNSHKKYAAISRESGVAAQTISNWFNGSTRRPQFATVAAVARACGQDITIGGKEVLPFGTAPEKKVSSALDSLIAAR